MSFQVSRPRSTTVKDVASGINCLFGVGCIAAASWLWMIQRCSRGSCALILISGLTSSMRILGMGLCWRNQALSNSLVARVSSLSIDERASPQWLWQTIKPRHSTHPPRFRRARTSVLIGVPAQHLLKDIHLIILGGISLHGHRQPKVLLTSCRPTSRCYHLWYRGGRCLCSGCATELVRRVSEASSATCLVIEAAGNSRQWGRREFRLHNLSITMCMSPWNHRVTDGGHERLLAFTTLHTTASPNFFTVHRLTRPCAPDPSGGIVLSHS